MPAEKSGYRQKKTEGTTDTWKEIFPNGGEAAYRAKEKADADAVERGKKAGKKARANNAWGI